MNKILILPLIFLISTAAANAQDTTGTTISSQKFSKLMKKRNTVILDVRTQEEYRSGFISDAVNYNVLDSLGFISKLSSLDKKKKYLLYCKSGRRSAKALMMMKTEGFKKVYHLKGGVTDWKSELHKPE
jgi:rhodanese-related sulfurtransferase